MRILIATVGTRGDIQPYIGLSQMLASAGHTVTIASSRTHQRLIEGFHIPFSCIDETGDSSAIQKVASKKGLNAVREGVRMLFDGMLQCHESLLEAAAGVDLIIGHGWLGEAESEICRKQFIRVGISPNIAEKVKDKATPLSERLRISLERAALDRMILKPYNEFLRNISFKTTDLKAIYEKPLFLPISKVLLDSMRLWNNRTYQSSYWYANYGGYTLPPDLNELLANGRKTVAVSFGSMMSGLKIDAGYIEDIYELAHQMDFNLIWVGPHSFSEHFLGSDRFLAVEELPLGSLLSRVDVVIHHCGLGTTSEVIRSGCPSIPVPFVIDQYDWAKRLVRTGAATKAMRPEHLAGTQLRKRLDLVFSNERYTENARRARETVLEEIETDQTVERIERICRS